MANQSNQLFLLMIVTVSSRNIQRALRDQKKNQSGNKYGVCKDALEQHLLQEKNNFEYDLKQFTK